MFYKKRFNNSLREKANVWSYHCVNLVSLNGPDFTTRASTKLDVTYSYKFILNKREKSAVPFMLGPHCFDQTFNHNRNFLFDHSMFTKR